MKIQIISGQPGRIYNGQATLTSPAPFAFSALLFTSGGYLLLEGKAVLMPEATPVHSFNQCLLSTYKMAGTVLSASPLGGCGLNLESVGPNPPGLRTGCVSAI